MYVIYADLIRNGNVHFNLVGLRYHIQAYGYRKITVEVWLAVCYNVP